MVHMLWGHIIDCYEVELNRCWVNVYGRSLNFQNGVISSNIFNIGLYRGLLAKRVIRHVKDAVTNLLLQHALLMA